MGSETRPCPQCGRVPGPGLVLAGWLPRICGGHSTTYCRPDVGGCGHTRHEPPLDRETCPPDTGHAPRVRAGC